MEYDLQLIGARLQAARKAKGYTQDYVSARADITEKFLSQIERGKAGLSVQTLIALCDILEITPNYVLLPDAARVLEEPIGPLLKGMSPGAGAETCGERPPGRNEARAGSALAARALRAFAQNRARRFAARNDPVRLSASRPWLRHPAPLFCRPVTAAPRRVPNGKTPALAPVRLHFARGETARPLFPHFCPARL